MALRSMSFALTTTPLVIASSTVVANSTLAFSLAGAHISDPVPVVVHNDSTQAIYVGGPAMSTASTAIGIPVATGNFTFNLMASDSLWGLTTAGTVTVQAMAGRQ